MSYNLWIPGPPQEMQRPRIVKTSQMAITGDYRDVVHLRNTSPVNQAKREIALRAKAAAPSGKPPTGPVEVLVRFHLPVPPSWPKWKKAAALDGRLRAQRKPDLDNYLKLLLDGLNGIWWKDDGQIWRMLVTKRYDAEPGTHVAAIFEPEVELMRDLPKINPADSGK